MPTPPNTPRSNKGLRDYQNRSDWWLVFAGFVMGLLVASMIAC